MKWAYKAIEFDPDEGKYTPEETMALTGADFARAVELALGPLAIESDLNALGQDGWELVAVVPGKASQDGRPWVAIFKRPV
jgi:hypothetical protein